MRWSVGPRSLSAAVACYYVLKAGWFKKKKLAHWDRKAAGPFAPPGRILAR